MCHSFLSWGSSIHTIHSTHLLITTSNKTKKYELKILNTGLSVCFWLSCKNKGGFLPTLVLCPFKFQSEPNQKLVMLLSLNYLFVKKESKREVRPQADPDNGMEMGDRGRRMNRGLIPRIATTGERSPHAYTPSKRVYNGIHFPILQLEYCTYFFVYRMQTWGATPNILWKGYLFY